MLPFRKPTQIALLLSFVTITLVAHQNCSRFNAIDQLDPSSQMGSSVNPPAPDFNSDILNKVGLKLGPRGNSTCQLQPPVIPAFEQVSDNANVFKVCKDGSCTYSTISDALTAAPAGSVIAIKEDTYNECVRITKDNITLQGRGGRPIVQASSCPSTAWYTAVIGVLANDIKIENLEITDPTGDKTMGIAWGISGANLTVHNVYFHHAAGGLAGVSKGGDITVTNSYFDDLGHMEGTDPHTTAALSIELQTRSANIRNVTITHPKQRGGTLFTNALKSTVDCVLVADLGGLSAILLANIYGFDLTVTNAVLQRGPDSDQRMMVYWDRTSDPVPYQFTAKNNIFISDRPTRDDAILVLAGDAVPTTITGNTFVGPNSLKYSNFPNSRSFESRAEAGLAADTLPYPGTLGF